MGPMFLDPLLAIGLLTLAAEPAATEPLSPGKVLWTRVPDAQASTPGAWPFDLSPGAAGVAYLQGDPWPRVLHQPIAGNAVEPVALGAFVPFGDRQPRFDAEGRRILFTADLSAPLEAERLPFPVRPPTRDRGRTLRLAIVRMGIDGRGSERLLPGPGASDEESWVLLDVHPVGGLLAGKATGVKSSEVSWGGFSLEVFEVDLDAAGNALSPRPLGFSVNGRASVRYSWDGSSIVYEQGPSPHVSGKPAPVMAFHRSSAVNEPLRTAGDSPGLLADDVEVYPVPLPHPGSFGWDPFALVLLARAAEGPWIPFAAGDSFASGGTAGAPLVPVSFRGDRVLLVGGPEDRRTLAVAAWDAGLFEARLAAVSRRPAPASAAGAVPWLPAVLEGRARADDAAAAELLEKLRASQELSPAPPFRCVRARWIHRDVPAAAVPPAAASPKRPKAASAAAKAETPPAAPIAAPAPAGERLPDGQRPPDEEIEAIAWTDGRLWIDRIHPPAKAGDPPFHDILAYDGKEARATDEEGRTTTLTPADLLQRSAVASPLRLLIDPAGLRAPWLRFRSAQPAPAPADGKAPEAGGGSPALEVRSIDGYRAELRVTLEGGRTVASRIESPLHFPTVKARREMGAVPPRKSVAFEEYRAVGARLVPGKIRFDDGIRPFELVLRELVLDPTDAEKVFR